MRRRRKRRDWLTPISIVCAGIAVVLMVGMIQSDTNVRFTECTVKIKSEKTLVSGMKKPTSRKLDCFSGSDRYVIALKDDLVMPNTPEHLLKNKRALACTFDVVTNRFNILSEQVLPETLACSPTGEVG